MKAFRNQSGFSTLVALTTVACLAAVALAFIQSMTITSMARRDTVSNAEINAFHLRLQKLLSTEWSCTLSLRGSNYNDPIVLMDPVHPEDRLAEDGMSAGPFWTLSSIRLKNVQPVQGRAGIQSGELDLAFTKLMTHQVGSPLVSRVVKEIWFEVSPEGMITRCYPSPIVQAMASAACKSLGGIWNSEQAFGSQCSGARGHGHDEAGEAPPTPDPSPTPDPTEPAPDPTPAPAPAPVPGGLCFNANAGIVAVPNSQMTMTGNGTTITGIYLLNGARLSLVGNATVEGTVFEGNEASHSVTGHATVAHVESGDLSSVSSGLSTFASAQTALVAGTELSKIDESMTLTASGQHTVVLVTGDVTLTGDRVLTLSGDASSKFVINVVGKITVSGNAQILLSGGVIPRNVIFNNIGIGNEMVLAGNGSISGTFMALQRGAQVSGNGHLTGAVVAGGGLNTKITIAGNGLAMTPDPFCTN